MHKYDWGSTSLGDPATWGDTLHAYVTCMLDSPLSSTIFWGDDWTIMRNDLPCPSPAGLLVPSYENPNGKVGAQVYGDAWQEMLPLLSRVVSSCSAFSSLDPTLMRVPLSSLPSDPSSPSYVSRYMRATYAPLARDDGTVGGVLVQYTDVTDSVLASTRANVLQTMSVCVDKAVSYGPALVDTCLKAMIATDSPFVLLYTVDTNVSESKSSSGGLGVPSRLVLRGCVGLPSSHPLALPELNAPQANDLWGMDHILKHRETNTVPLDLDLDLDLSSVHVDQAHVMPLWRRDNATATLTGFLIVGHRHASPADSSYVRFLECASKIIASFVSLPLPTSNSPTILFKLQAAQEAENDAKRLAELAENTRRRQELFVDMICHEIRNPLNGIINNADLLLTSLEERASAIGLMHDPGNDLIRQMVEDKEAIEAIQACAKHQKVITDDALHLSKLESGLVDLNISAFRPSRVISNTLRMFEAETQAKDIALVATLPPNADFIVVRGDPDRLVQVIVNLVGNSVKFTQAAPVRNIMLEMDVNMSTSTLHFSVTDSGIGMNESEQQSLFQRFMQASSFTSKRYGGSGLGLYICRLLVNMMGGTITVESEPGRGSKFSFSIKVEFVDPSALADSSESSPSLSATLSPYTGTPFAHTPSSSSAASMSPAVSSTSSPVLLSDPHTSDIESPDPLSLFGLPLSAQSSSSSLPSSFTTPHPVSNLSSSLGRLSSLSDIVPSAPSLELKSLSLSNIHSHRPTSPRRDQPSSPTSPGNPRSRIQGTHILVVEDNTVNQKVLRRHLEASGCTCTLAENGQVALDLVTQGNVYSLIFMDVEMPVLDGLQATQRIRSWEESTGASPVPIVGLSGNARPKHKSEALVAGMQAFLTKPYEKQDLLNTIITLLGVGASP
eukprot:TRINITY_DN2183_c0_g3_i2.p1 TRINITY_DN2183_c0_g3~~TRINITY_DN2183_c0_g3_i2.p1  ORF type:complete len:898 (-),score=243.58 TRINITY_DN2183_c0_g3_i2:23-2716(-)